jgi:hypothetical protein
MMMALSVLTKGCVARSALGSEEDVLPKKKLSFDCCQRCMRIGASDQTKFVGIDTEFAFYLQTVPES